MENESLVTLTAEIASAYVANNRIETSAVGGLVEDIHRALATLGVEESQPEALEPAVSVRASVKKDHLVCLACGKKMKILKRHLATEHDMTPEGYREAYNLSREYPLVAPDYAAARSELAKKAGLGRKPHANRGRKPRSAAGKNGNSKGVEGK